MALTAQQSQQLYGTPAYTGWGETEAMYDARNKGLSGGGGSSGGGSVQDQYNSILDPIISAITGNIKQIKPYDQVNPFSFDEQLARQASTAEYSPYYDQMLTDYTSAVERNKSRSQEDLQNTLTQLAAGKEYYMGTERRLLDRTLDNVNKGYAGQGLFFSGARQKDISQLNTEYGAQTDEYNRQYGQNVQQAQTAAQRTGQDLSTASSMYSRDVGQAKQSAIEQGVLQRKSEAIQQYDVGMQKYYQQPIYG